MQGRSSEQLRLRTNCRRARQRASASEVSTVLPATLKRFEKWARERGCISLVTTARVALRLTYVRSHVRVDESCSCVQAWMTRRKVLIVCDQRVARGPTHSRAQTAGRSARHSGPSYCGPAAARRANQVVQRLSSSWLVSVCEIRASCLHPRPRLRLRDRSTAAERSGWAPAV